MLLEVVGYQDIVIFSDYQYGNYSTHVNQIFPFEAKIS